MAFASAVDPREGGACIGCLSTKFACIIMGWVHLVFWVLGTLTLIFSPSSVNLFAQNSTTGQYVISVLFCLMCTGFVVILLIGVHKDRPVFIRMYYIYCMVMVIVYIICFIVNIFLNPKLVDFKYFMQVVFSMAFNILCCLIARGYYLMTYCHRSPNTVTDTKNPSPI